MFKIKPAETTPATEDLFSLFRNRGHYRPFFMKNDDRLWFIVGLISCSGPGTRTPNEAPGPFTAEAISEMLKDVENYASGTFQICNVSETTAILLSEHHDTFFKDHEIMLDGRSVITNRAGNFYRYLDQVMKFYWLEEIKKLNDLDIEVETNLRSTDVYVTVNGGGEKLNIRCIATSERQAMAALDINLGQNWLPVMSDGKRYFITY